MSTSTDPATGPIPVQSSPLDDDPTRLGVLGWTPVCDMAVFGPRKPATAALIVTCPVGHVTVNLMCAHHAALMRDAAGQMPAGGRCQTCARPTRIEVRGL